ncbi:MAG: hypothetical protein FD144_426 [Rhodospirillaceae bacterium]|nr:MAG: hypothetical protein FD144_426 [Rhodospirillaceae bacterium]
MRQSGGVEMFGDRGPSLPAAGMAVVALFASTTYFGQRAFESLRQPELEATQQFQWLEPPVEARLWEDPLAALRRHRETLRKTCHSGGEKSEGQRNVNDVRCKDAQPLNDQRFKETFQGQNKLSALVVALLPGAAFAREEEARRRARYALLTGMNAAGFEPDVSERMGWLRVRRCESFGACVEGDPGMHLFRKYTKRVAATLRTPHKPDAASEKLKLPAILKESLSVVLEKLTPNVPAPPTMEIVYETLSTTSATEPKRRIAVLWVDDTNLGGRWLAQSAMLLRDVSPNEDLQLRIVGPTSSNGLAKALEDLTQLAKEAGNIDKHRRREDFEQNWRVLNRLQLVSHISTAPAVELLGALPDESPAKKAGSMADGFRLLLQEIQKNLDDSRPKSRNRVSPMDPPPRPSDKAKPPFFVPTVGTDDLLIKALVRELCERGLDERANGVDRTVALIREWDSVYARSFEGELDRELQHGSACGNSKKPDVKLVSYQYMRGLDGLTIEGLAKQSQRHGDKPRDQKASIEWAEGRQQRDYLRRLVTEKLGRTGVSIDLQAIGIIGSDVHDKLILAQALRDEFPDRMIFTTDLDARLVHPSMLPYTRNLIVASSLPLALGDDLQCGVSPFRDIYQTAMFLAARYAALDESEKKRGESGRSCGSVSSRSVKERISAEIGKPHLFEIGREGAKELTGPRSPPPPVSDVVWEAQQATRSLYAKLAAAVLLVVGWMIAFVRPGPAMRTMSRFLLGRPAESYPEAASRSAWSTIMIAGAQFAAFGFVAGVVVELACPGRVGLKGAVLLAMALGAIASAFFALATWWSNGDPAGPVVRKRALALCVSACAAAAVWWVWAPEGHDEQLYEPFALLSGISAWPSELLRALAILLFAWFLDYAWCKTFLQAERIEEEYFPNTGAPPDGASTSWLRRHLRYYSIFLFAWQDKVSSDDPVDGSALWHEYRMRLRGRQRLVRVVVGSVLLTLFLILMGRVIGGIAPETPARGIGDRMLFEWTLIVSGTATMVLMVVVADSTMLTWRFITLLKSGRTFYPQATVQRFAAELGTELRDRAGRPVPAQPIDRGHKFGSNSLLDDWIDARLFARHTAVVGPLIIFPFVLLAVLIIARSRLFDNWQVGGFILAAFVFLVLWSVAMAALLNHGAEVARRVSLERMEQDLLWLKGAGKKYAGLAEQFPRLIEQVRNLRQGAFAPFFEQPVVQAVLVPLGGAGGTQLLELILLARST